MILNRGVLGFYWVKRLGLLRDNIVHVSLLIFEIHDTWPIFMCPFINRQVAELEKKQKNFDKTLAEEKTIGERNATERDAAEREAREKETRVLSLSRELDESSEKVEELERVKRQLQAELDELVNNQGTDFCYHHKFLLHISHPPTSIESLNVYSI